MSLHPGKTHWRHVIALRHGREARMRIIERDGRLILWDGLATHELAGPAADWTGAALAAEVQRLTGAERVVLA